MVDCTNGRGNKQREDGRPTKSRLVMAVSPVDQNQICGQPLNSPKMISICPSANMPLFSRLLFSVLLLASSIHFRCYPSPNLDCLAHSYRCRNAFLVVPICPCRVKLSEQLETTCSDSSSALFVDGARLESSGDWEKFKSDGKARGREIDESFLFQMADVSGQKSREKHTKIGRASKKYREGANQRRAPTEMKAGGSKEMTSKMKKVNARSGENDVRTRAADTSTVQSTTFAAPLASSSTSLPALMTTSKASERSTGTNSEDRKRSASREHKVTSSRPAAVGGTHLNISALSSHPHHRKGGQGQKRGGGGRPPNWHELSSTEQSIAMMLRCQDLETRELLPAAVTCRNLRSDKVCNYLFHEVDKKTGRRDVKCNLQGLEDIAESCRKSCGICCEDINYACEDDKNGIIDCSRQLEKCHQKKWFGVLSRFCAGSCGLCAMTTCRDFDNSCRVRRALCLKPDSVDYMRENCARTCGFCVTGEEESGGDKKGGGSGKGSAGNSGSPVVVERPLTQHRLIVPECTDKAGNCSASAHLCGSPVHGEYMVKFCTKTCLKCNPRTKQPEFPEPPPLVVSIQPLIGESSAAGTRKARKCEDQDERCAKWKAEDLCKSNRSENNEKFKDERMKLCPKSCDLCK